MKINIQNLEQGLIEVDSETETAFLDRDMQPYYPDKVALHIVIDKFGKDYRLSINLSTTAHYLCDRCLTNFKRNFEAAQTQIYHIGEDKLEKSEDIIRLPANTTEIDISPVLEEVILLNHPIKMICQEDCKGICPNCGVDLNKKDCKCSEKSTDPRWAELKRLIE